MSSPDSFRSGSVQLERRDCLEWLAELPSNTAGAVVTDPPYCSGGGTRAEVQNSTSKKYQSGGTKKQYVDFAGDSLSEHAFFRWSLAWMREAFRATKPTGYLLVFTDWRQIANMSDAVQAAGWNYRGNIIWDKTESSRAPHKGYFRHQAEYVIWATKGRCRKATHDGPFPGVIRCYQHNSKKLHVTGKPIELMEELLRCVDPGELVLDPFAGSASTLLAAQNKGFRASGCEIEPKIFETAVSRLRAAEANAALSV